MTSATNFIPLTEETIDEIALNTKNTKAELIELLKRRAAANQVEVFVMTDYLINKGENA